MRLTFVYVLLLSLAGPMKAHSLKLDNNAEFITTFQVCSDFVKGQDHWLKPFNFKLVQKTVVFFVFYEVDPVYIRIVCKHMDNSSSNILQPTMPRTVMAISWTRLLKNILNGRANNS